MKIAFGCDPNAGHLKTVLEKTATDLGHEVVECGSDDPIYAHTAVTVAEAVARGDADRGVVLCGTGIGVSIAANKVKGVRCALLTDAYQAERAQLSNDANVVAFGAQVTGEQLAQKLLTEYLAHTYVEGTRSAPKVDAIAAYENGSC